MSGPPYRCGGGPDTLARKGRGWDHRSDPATRRHSPWRGPGCVQVRLSHSYPMKVLANACDRAIPDLALPSRLIRGGTGVLSTCRVVPRRGAPSAEDSGPCSGVRRPSAPPSAGGRCHELRSICGARRSARVFTAGYAISSCGCGRRSRRRLTVGRRGPREWESLARNLRADRVTPVGTTE